MMKSRKFEREQKESLGIGRREDPLSRIVG
jgi:hypothetical protein